MFRFPRAVLPFALTLAAVATALAHEDAVLDLHPLEVHVAAQIAVVTDPPVRKAYKELRKKLSTPTREKLTKDLGKVAAAAKAAAGPLSADVALSGIVGDALDAADQALAERPEAVSVQIAKIARASKRSRVETVALAAYTLHQEGRALRNPIDEREAAARFRAAGRKYDEAIALAKLLAKGQGGPLPQFKTAQAGNVYTVVGTGQGGFNGDGHEARRTHLYFVDECAISPVDGRLYILDWNNHRVRCLETDGTVSAICGSGVPDDSEGDPEATGLNHPSSLAFAPDGRLFLAAWHNHKVKVYDPTGTTPRVYTIAGGPQGNVGEGVPATQARFNLLPGILLLPNGDILATDAANSVIRKVELSVPVTDTNVAGVEVQTGLITRFAGTTGQQDQTGTDGNGDQALLAKLAFSRAQNAEPDGRLARDAAGNVYVVSGLRNVIRKIAPDGTISTFAGTGTAGYSGDGMLATAAQLNGPSDIAVGVPGSVFEGSIFISDSNNNVIRRVLPDGTIETYAGLGQNGYEGDEGPRAAAKFNRPGGIEVDAQGNLYVCDRYNSVIRVIASPAPGALRVPIEPYRLPLPSRGNAPTTGTSGTIDTYAGSGLLGFNGNDRPALDTELYWPQDVTVDPANGLVYLLDWNNHRIRRVEAGGTVSTVIGSGQLGDTAGTLGGAQSERLNHPTDLAFHPVTGELWIAAWHTDKILRLDASTNTLHYMAGGTRNYTGDDGPPISATMNIPSSVKFDALGNWYIGDEGNRRVRFVDAALNEMTTLVGSAAPISQLGDGGPALQASLNFPVGQSAQPGGRVCLSPDDRWLYIADTLNHRIRRVDLQDVQKTITTFVGSGTRGFSGDGAQAVDARLDFPTDVDCDGAGNLYIADQENDCIRRVDIGTNVITTVVGTGGSAGYAGDGGLAGAAKLSRPSGIFVERSGPRAGRMYVADTYNGVIRVIWE